MMVSASGVKSLIEEWIKKADVCDSVPINSLEPIAITGLSGFLPSCMDVKSFWEKLDKDESLITEIPTERFDWQVYYEPTGKTQGTIRTKWGGFIPDIASFDPRHFNLLLFEASEMDPRVRLLLMSTWRTLEDAGINPDILKKSNTGVFIGCESNEYFQLMHNKGIAPKGLLSRADGMIANQISYNFDFLGPSEFINTMCSSFAVALHRAVMCLRSGQVDRAIVGGANLSLIPDPFIALSQEKLLSQEPTVKSFGKDAEGYLRSEGVGTILIERLSQAEREHHQIYALIKHSGVNYNGRGGMSIAAPNTDAHTKLIKACYREAQIDPRQISYIEAQGMGLPVADIVEWTAMNRALSELCEEYGYAFTPGYCRVSTLKPMAGHMHAAASLGSLLKIIRSFQTDKIHKILDYTEPNEYCEMGNTPCRIAAETTEWARKEYPRLAAFHSYGAGGSNAHILLEEYLADKDSKREAYYRDIVAPVMICFSERTEEQLKKVITEMRDHLHRVPAHDFINLSYTLITGRKAFDYRCAVIAESIAELIEILNKVLHGGQSDNYYSGKVSVASVVDVTLQPGGIDLKALAKSWVNGALLQHTEILYSHHQVKCLPGLPGYSFDTKHCWFQKEENDSLRKKSVSQKVDNMNQQVQQAIKKILGVDKKDLESNMSFSELGIDSLSIHAFINKLETEFNIKLRRSDIFNYSNMEKMSEYIASKILTDTIDQKGLKNQFPELIHLNEQSNDQPVFWFHAGLGGAQLYHIIAEQIERPFFGIQARGWQTKRAPLLGIQAMAAYYVQIIQHTQTEGSYDLGGYSLGGMIAYEVARQLQELGHTVNSIIMLDGFDTAVFKEKKVVEQSVKTKMLQAINFLLMSMMKFDMGKVNMQLIHRKQLNWKLSDEDFLEEIILLSRQSILKMNELELRENIKQTARVQKAYEVERFSILPMTDPKSIKCYFLRNKSGLYWGKLEAYFASARKQCLFDHLNYWSMWEEQLPNFNIIDVDSSNHMMLLSEEKSLKQIIDFCKNFYSSGEILP